MLKITKYFVFPSKSLCFWGLEKAYSMMLTLAPRPGESPSPWVGRAFLVKGVGRHRVRAIRIRYGIPCSPTYSTVGVVLFALRQDWAA